jgi:hypothetical protein
MMLIAHINSIMNSPPKKRVLNRPNWGGCIPSLALGANTQPATTPNTPVAQASSQTSYSADLQHKWKKCKNVLAPCLVPVMLPSSAWIISSGKVDDIMTPILNISGAGAVHGMPKYLSSARGELQGITAISIILNLLSDYHHKRITTSSICGNIGVINKCTNGHFSSLRHNRGANLCRGNIRSDPR